MGVKHGPGSIDGQPPIHPCAFPVFDNLDDAVLNIQPVGGTAQAPRDNGCFLADVRRRRQQAWDQTQAQKKRIAGQKIAGQRRARRVDADERLTGNTAPEAGGEPALVLRAQDLGPIGE